MGTFRRRRAGDPAKAQAKARDPEAARSAAIAQLARRDFASGELRLKLEAQGFDKTLVAAVIGELTQERALDDARYAEHYVASHAQRGHGPLRIAADLRSLGIPDPLIDSALGAGPDWRKLAHEVRIRKFGAETPEEWAEKTRQARFLQYRGFSSDHIRAATGADFDADS
ncbi:MAG TPA: regulatory protein RecX [Steroidobacteraceae bacterium]